MTRPGQRVRIVADGSCFYNARGTVTETLDGAAMVLVDGDDRPIRFGLEALETLEAE